MRRQVKSFVVEVKNSRKTTEAGKNKLWGDALLAAAEDLAPARPTAPFIAAEPKEAAAVHRILPDLREPAPAETAEPGQPGRAAPSAAERLGEIASERRAVIAAAKRQALKAAEQAIETLNQLGFNYRLLKD